MNPPKWAVDVYLWVGGWSVIVGTIVGVLGFAVYVAMTVGKKR